jgi:hypothetical protein
METTYYGQPVDGEPGNHNLSARFDWTRGYLGITQKGGEWGAAGNVTDRVLLSPAQVRVLRTFLEDHKR